MKSFLQSLNNAVNGFLYVVRHERNMRIHFLVAFFILVLAVFLGVSRVEWMLLCCSIAFVLMAEMINTAVEDALDAVQPAFHPAIKVIKDVSAGTVLVSALNALAIGFVIFSEYLGTPFQLATARLRHASWHLTFVVLLVVIFIVICLKAYVKKGTPFRGGIVSGHSATAFALWTVVLFAQNNNFITAVTFLIAALVAQSRLRSKIHSFWEVVGGAVIGVLVTMVFFQIFQ